MRLVRNVMRQAKSMKNNQKSYKINLLRVSFSNNETRETLVRRDTHEKRLAGLCKFGVYVRVWFRVRVVVSI